MEKCTEIMEDKRIRRTRRILKETLIEMLNETPFEQITVTNICNRSEISRITFYTHYNDKYALMEDIFSEMAKNGEEKYRALEQAHNPQGDLTLGFIHVIDCILEVIYQHLGFFRQVDPEKNPYIASAFSNIVLKTVEHHTIKESYKHTMKYTAGQITGFLCYGLLGFIIESGTEHRNDYESIKQDVESLVLKLLRSDILFTL